MAIIKIERESLNREGNNRDVFLNDGKGKEHLRDIHWLNVQVNKQ